MCIRDRLSSSSSLLEDGSSLELWEEDEGSDGSSRPWQPESGASKSMADSTRASAFCAMDRFIETSLKKMCIRDRERAVQRFSSVRQTVTRES